MNDTPALNLLVDAALSEGKKRIAFINAFAHPSLQLLANQSTSLCLVQTFKPAIHDLQILGMDVSTLEGQFDIVLMMPSKDKVLSLSWMALAFQHLGEHGRLIVACENQYGAKSYVSALQKLAGVVGFRSKAKCRLFSARKTDALDQCLQQCWLDSAAVKQMPDGSLWSQAGVFGWRAVDVGSALLLEHLPRFSGKGMDLCCGYGVLACAVLKASPAIQELHMVDADLLALACSKKNTDAFSGVAFHHLDAAKEALPKHLDWIVCNPPFHTGQKRDVELGRSIVLRACDSLKYGGVLYLVANRQLAYEKILKGCLSDVELLAVGHGFKVIRGRK